MPNEFSAEIAMGLFANIPNVEAAQSLALARGISIALGNESALAAAIFSITGSEKLAQRVEIQSRLAKAHNNG
jgi:hypothetical protein